MSKNLKFNVSKLLASNWMITVTATLLGVFLALYVNEWMSSKNQRAQRELATKNILEEISTNQEVLNNSLSRHKELAVFIEFLDKYKGRSEDLIAPQDTMAKFRAEYPNLLIIQDSTYVSDGVYKYKGTSDLDFNFSKLAMTNIAWRTMINSGINSTYDFDCLMYLEKVDNLYKEIVKNDEIFIEYLQKYFRKELENDILSNHLHWQISLEEGLKTMYEASEDELRNCG